MQPIANRCLPNADGLRKVLLQDAGISEMVLEDVVHALQITLYRKVLASAILRYTEFERLAVQRKVRGMRLLIATIRNAKGLHQVDVAEAAGIRVATLSEIENGKGNPRLDTLQKIATALGVTLPELFEADAEYVPDERDIINDFRALEDEDRRLLKDMVSRMLGASRPTT